MEVVGIAKDGLEALEVIKEKLPDIVILDVITVHLDGLGVLEQLSSLSLDKTPSCIMLSAVGQEKITQKNYIFRSYEYYTVSLNLWNRCIDKKNKRIEILLSCYAKKTNVGSREEKLITCNNWP